MHHISPWVYELVGNKCFQTIIEYLWMAQGILNWRFSFLHHVLQFCVTTCLKIVIYFIDPKRLVKREYEAILFLYATYLNKLYILYAYCVLYTQTFEYVYLSNVFWCVLELSLWNNSDFSWCAYTILFTVSMFKLEFCLTLLWNKHKLVVVVELYKIGTNENLMKWKLFYRMPF